MRINGNNGPDKPDLVARAVAYLKLEFLNPDFGALFDKIRSGVILSLCGQYIGMGLGRVAVGRQVEGIEQRFQIAYNLCMDGLEAKRQNDLYGV